MVRPRRTCQKSCACETGSFVGASFPTSKLTSLAPKYKRKIGAGHRDWLTPVCYLSRKYHERSHHLLPLVLRIPCYHDIPGWQMLASGACERVALLRALQPTLTAFQSWHTAGIPWEPKCLFPVKHKYCRDHKFVWGLSLGSGKRNCIGRPQSPE